LFWARREGEKEGAAKSFLVCFDFYFAFKKGGKKRGRGVDY